MLIDKAHEWHVLSLFFSEEIQLKILPDDVSDLIKRLKYTSSIQRNIDDFNSDTSLINVKNGVLHYPSKKLISHDPNHLFNYQLDVSYLPNVRIEQAPFFKMFCETSLNNDKQKIKLLLTIIGYLCSMLMCAKKCFILLGEANSGKSMLCHLIEFMVGETNTAHIPLENLGNRFSTSILSTKRLNICGELSATPLKNIETFKLIVGGDELSAEFKCKDVFQFKNRCKLLYAGNVLPPIKNEDTSTAFIDRLTVLRFTRSIPEEERIRNMYEQLTAEADVIFSLSIDALNDLCKNNFIFDCPSDTRELLEDYAFQQTNIDRFIKERCMLGGDYKIYSSDLYQAYKAFCADNVIKPFSHIMFSQRVGSISGISNRTIRMKGGISARGFWGIALNNQPAQVSEKYDNENELKNNASHSKHSSQQLRMEEN